MFLKIALLLGCSELLLKSMVLACAYGVNRECANIYNGVIIVFYSIAHLSLWIYSLTLFTS